MLCKHCYSTVRALFVFYVVVVVVVCEWENFSYLELFCSWLAGKMFKQSKDVSQKLTF